MKTGKRLIMVLGMHRCGTSFLCQILEQLGLTFPNNLLPANELDNPLGYFEAQEIVQINNLFLKEINVDWRSTEPLPDAVFNGDLATQYRNKIINYFDRHPVHQPLVIKDPRLCRLLPLWQPVLKNYFDDISYITIMRHPLAVAKSLSKRAEVAALAPAAITCVYQSLSLWLTYNLDLLNHSQGTKNLLLDYHSLVATPEQCANKISQFLQIEKKSVINKLPVDIGLLQQNIQHYKEQSGIDTQTLDYFEKLYYLFIQDRFSAENILYLKNSLCGDLLIKRKLIECLDKSHPLTSLCRGALKELMSKSHGRVNRWSWTSSQQAPAELDVFFISHNATTRGHIYRVTNICDTLNQINVSAAWIEIDDLEKIISLPVNIKCLVIFRCEYTPQLEKFIDKCRRKRTRIIYDIDDFIFDTSVLDHDECHFTSVLTVNDKNQWYQRFQSYRRVMETADAICVPTETLQKFSQNTCPSTIVFPNTFDRVSKRIADLARSLNATRLTSNVVIGYTSGTPTHELDFLTIQPVIIKLLKMYPNLELKIVGYLNSIEDRVFDSYRDRIRVSPIVPHTALPFELAEFGINLIPLERNSFTDAKSELKFFETALLNVPSVAVNNPVYSKIIEQGQNGYLATDEQGWLDALSLLIEDSELRRRLGEAAYKTATENYAVEDLVQQYKTEVLALN